VVRMAVVGLHGGVVAVIVVRVVYVTVVGVGDVVGVVTSSHGVSFAHPYRPAPPGRM